MIGKEDIIIIESSGERDISAEYFTMQLWKSRNYKLKETGKQNTELQKLKIEFLTEFSFVEYLCSELSLHFDSKVLDWSINKAELNDRNILLVGINEAKTQRTIREKTIELKTYHTGKVTVEEILGLNPYTQPMKTFIDLLSYPKTDIFVQAYLLTDNSIALTGFRRGFLKHTGTRPEFYAQKYVTELFKMKELINEFL